MRASRLNFLLENQFLSILLSTAAGALCTLWLYRVSSGDRAWKIADLVWVFLGGLSALAAIASATYENDRGRFDRQSDVIYATTKGFEVNAARFRLLHCEVDRQGSLYRPSTVDLCEKIEFLSASTARYRNLPLFLTVSEGQGALFSIRRLFGLGDRPSPDDQMSQDAMMKEINSFDAVELLRFSARDEKTDAAVAVLGQSRNNADIAAEYQVLATTYEELIGQLDRLTVEWAYLQDNSAVLLLRVLALCLLGFAAPFRLGKSVVELR